MNGSASKVPRVTVLMPAYNAAAFVGAAIESVLAQTCADFELLVIDDGSTDATREIVAGYRDSRLRLLTNGRNCGLIETLNRGLREARGEFLARLDADDLAMPSRLGEQLAFFAQHPEVPLLGTLADQIDEVGRPLGRIHLPLESLGIRWALLFDNPFLHSAVMFRTRTVRDEFGGYDPAAVGSEDFALWSRIARRYPTANLGRRLIQLRVHGASIMRAQKPVVEAGTQRNLRANLQAEFPGRPFSEEEFALLAEARGMVPPARLDAWHGVVDELFERFCARHPAARASRDLSRTVARQAAGLAYNLLPAHRAAALREYARSVRADPAVLAALPWPRLLALLLLGDSARDLHRRLFPAK